MAILYCAYCRNIVTGIFAIRRTNEQQKMLVLRIAVVWNYFIPVNLGMQFQISCGIYTGSDYDIGRWYIYDKREN